MRRGEGSEEEEEEVAEILDEFSSKGGEDEDDEEEALETHREKRQAHRCSILAAGAKQINN
jgi:hypothetical protein